MLKRLTHCSNIAQDPETLEEIRRTKAIKVARAQKEAEEATKKYLKEQEEMRKLREEEAAKKGVYIP